ncbi:hypothetical protein LSAT2_032248 [Lamellibrachia satsuma]|nr:hypothetical protein LSAT2_032248 [Lamellibrachia satsuma]
MILSIYKIGALNDAVWSSISSVILALSETTEHVTWTDLHDDIEPVVRSAVLYYHLVEHILQHNADIDDKLARDVAIVVMTSLSPSTSIVKTVVSFPTRCRHSECVNNILYIM